MMEPVESRRVLSMVCSSLLFVGEKVLTLVLVVVFDEQVEKPNTSETCSVGRCKLPAQWTDGEDKLLQFCTNSRLFLYLRKFK